MADELGAVRRTPRPTGDRQTPETAAQESAGTTNTASPVSGDQPAVSSRVSSRPAFGDPEGPRRDPVGTVRTHDDGSRAVKVTDGLATHPWCSVTPREGTVWLAHEDVAEWGTEREWRLEELRAKLAEDPGSILLAGPECDMEAYAALPPCTACEGGGQDTHGTVFEAPLAVHFAAPEIELATVGRLRQLCLWCGHVLLDVPLANAPKPWPPASLVRIEDGVPTIEPYEPGDPLPPGCCALPDDEPASSACPTECDADCTADCHEGHHVPWKRQHEPERCGKHTGNCSNRCLLPAHHDGECDDDPHPDEAQETRAADWPAEEADRG